eukprot:g6385.t1
MGMTRLISTPLLVGALVAPCAITCEAFLGIPGTFSQAPLQQQQQLFRMCRRCHTLPVAMLTPSSRPRSARRTSSSIGRWGSSSGRWGSGSGSSSSGSTTVLFVADGGGAPTPNGPGTQNLSREAKLAISVLIDIIGVSSFAVPGVGEATDLGWAPISSALIFYLYGNSIFAGLAFVEEILPGFDVIPTATIAWFLTNSEVGQNVTNAAAGKKTGVRSGAGSSTAPPPPGGRGAAGSRKVDDELVQSGVIDVDAQD